MKRSRVSIVGSAMADPNRAQILAALCSGRSHTAGELARWVGLAASTTSRHLSVLVDAGLVTVTPSGRTRLFIISSEDLALWLEQLEGLDLPQTTAPKRPSPQSALGFARSCYDHLAGRVGVGLYQAMVTDGLLIDSDRPTPTGMGTARFRDLGVNVALLARKRRPLARQCLDWTEREHHLGGSLGAALLQLMHDRKWVRHGTDRRVLQFTEVGEAELRNSFNCDLALLRSRTE